MVPVVQKKKRKKVKKKLKTLKTTFYETDTILGTAEVVDCSNTQIFQGSQNRPVS